MIWSLLSWLSQHPGQVIAVLVLLSAGTWIISAVVYAVMLAHEAEDATPEFKRESQR